MTTNALLGKWTIDPDDVYALAWYGNIGYEFHADGTLVHTIQNHDRVQTINFTYAVEGEELVIRRTAAVTHQRLRFVLLAADKLELHLDNVASRFVRQPD